MKTPSRNPSRRSFLKTTLLAGAGAGGHAACQGTLGSAVPARRRGRYMGDFAAASLERVRLGFIGTGARGSGHVAQMLLMEGVDLVAISDNHAPAAEASAERCVQAGRPRPALYCAGDLAFREMFEREKLDAVLISTPWRWHAPMGVEAMHAGIHAFIEVPIAPTLAEMWQLVDASESTGRHCMMMENVCYGRDELLFLNMVRQGVLGEIVHGEAAYIHDLRGQIRQFERGTGSWRLDHHVQRNGNLYPTHGLGPIAQYMGCERGEDRLERLVSFSSPAFGRQLQAQRDFAPDHPRNQVTYIQADMNSSLIRTRRGRTVLVQHDTNSPRPYTRLNLISGTRGTLAGFPTRVALDPDGDGAHHWLQGADLEPIYEQYEHPLYDFVGARAREAGGHGGMDFIMLWRMVYCLRNGLPLDQNVYEGCSWSAVAPLSEHSVAHGGEPAEFPDFTRGDWSKTEPLGIVKGQA